ncbi:hypothetical protein [Methanothrix soehngenii]|uniref:hypothetical protein n=1 Tax=Methanothrix soehngenii TaxID=2223 RepID=UPI00300C8F71
MSEAEACPALVEALVRETPPLSVESMTLPISAFRAWMRDAHKSLKALDQGDVEGDFVEELPERTKGAEGDFVWVLENDKARREQLGRLRPGAMVLIDCRRGGLDAYGFAPDESGTEATDLTYLARAKDARAARIVWAPCLMGQWFSDAEGGAVAVKATRALLREVNELEMTDAEAGLELAAWCGEHWRLCSRRWRLW